VTVVALKVLLASITALLGVWVVRRPKLMTLPERRFLSLALAIQLLPAAVVFMTLYVIGHQEVASDVPGFYLPAARAVLAGQLPYRDFEQSYAPLFPYVGAALVYLWNNPRAFALFAIGLNAITLVLWHRAARVCYDSGAARQTSILYATSGHVLIQTLLGTNQIWVATALAGSTWLICRDRSGASGLLQGCSACATKLLALLFWPVLWICAARRGRWLLGAVLVTAVVYGGFAAMGADLLEPVHREGELFSSGNIPFLLEPLSAPLANLRYLPFDALALLGFGLTVIWIYRRVDPLPASMRARLLPAALALTGLVFMLLSKKSITGYALFFMYPAILMLCLTGGSLRHRAGFLLTFNVLLAVEPSLWFRIGRWRALSNWLAEAGGATATGVVVLELALLAAYGYLAWLSVAYIQRTGRGCGSEAVGAALVTPGATS
jgi:hypothetical protein